MASRLELTHCVTFDVGLCRVPGYPTDESSAQFRFAGSITRIGNFTLNIFILINYDAINKADMKTYHWKRQNILFATRYPLNKAVATITGLRHRLRNRVRLCQDWQLLCLSVYFRVPAYPTVTGIGYPVPKISVNARA